MYKIYFIDRDATIYERYPERNTGIDSIIELTKIVCGSRDDNRNILQNTYNTRILLDFNSQVTALRNEINSRKMPLFGNHPLSSSAFISLRLATGNSLPSEFSIEAYPLSESWSSGTGTYDSTPESRLGASWYYRTGTDVNTPLYWNTGSAKSSQFNSVSRIGGGTWLTGSSYRAVQNFVNIDTADVRMNITSIMKSWINSTISNYGLIIKWPHAVEISDRVAGSLKFFSRESNTIFVPRLEVAYNDVNLNGTGSVAEINTDAYVPYFTNLRAVYHDSEKAKLRLSVRPEFPTRTFQTSSVYLDMFRLPTSSFWSVVDSVTNDTIIPFDTGSTRISCDQHGNYFTLDLNSFMTDRYYNIILRVERGGGNDIQIHDNRYYFRVDK
jgi:hypothetical protein